MKRSFVFLLAVTGFLQVSAAPAIKNKIDIRPGVWTVKYTPNQATRVYIVTEQGEVKLHEVDLKGKLELNKLNDVVLDFDDGKLERWTMGKDGRLFVEHFNPTSTYPERPDQIGVGTLQKAEK